MTTGTVFRRIARLWLPALASGLLPALLHAAPGGGTIRHAEPVALERLLPAPAADGRASDRRVAIEAYGRHFDLQLQSNEAVLRRLTPERRRGLPSRALYRGTLVGQPGSWVRLTVLPDGVHGLIHDGHELYLLAPAARVRARLLEPQAGSPRQTLLFRAADVTASAGSCAVQRSPAASSTQAQYTALARELSALAPAAAQTAAATVSRQLELSVLGDFEYVGGRANPESDLLALVNAVDGIYSAQVGVGLVPKDLRVFRSSADPFTERNATRLLDEVAAYRDSVPELAATGITHLATGRDLDGLTVGIAYLGSVCDRRDAVSLSEQDDPSTGYLIVAHEIGHNLGAPHDGEDGSECSFEPQTRLMAPAVNYSTRFSNCSLEQMRPVLERATCLVAAPADGALAFLGSGIVTGYTGAPIPLTLEVASIGGAALREARVRIATGRLSALSASVPGGSCTLAADFVDCSLGDLPSGSARIVSLSLDGGHLGGEVTLEATLSAASDANAANNRRTATLRVQYGKVLNVAVESAPAALNVGGQGEVVALLRNDGVQTIENLTLDLDAGAFSLAIASVSAVGADCTAIDAQRWRCRFGAALPPGASLRVVAGVRGTALGIGSLRLSSAFPTAGIAGSATTQVPVKVVADVRVQGSVTDSFAFEGRPTPYTVWVYTDGSDSSREVVLQLLLPAALAVSRAPTACREQAPGDWRCTLGDLAPGAHPQAFELLPGEPGNYTVSTVVSSSNDLDLNNNRATDALTIGPYIDLGIRALDGPLTVKLGRTVEARLELTSAGSPFPAGATLRLSGSPDGALALESAALSAGRCNPSGNELLCTLDALPRNARVPVTVRLRPLRADGLPAQLFARLIATSDRDSGNQSASIAIQILPIGDASITAYGAAPELRLNQTQDLVPFALQTGPATEQVTVEMRVGPGLRIDGASADGGSCSVEPGLARCVLGDLPAGARRLLQLRVTPLQSGSVELRAATLSADDSSTANDTASWTVLVPTVVVQPPSSGGGGGGGGALDPGWLLLLGLGLAARRRTRPAA